ncbi:H-NS histone family protein [Luminiphilus sp.]|nr:H-NS histone family protein [Luminiphilus sp.]
MSKSALLKIGKSKTTARKIAGQVSLSDLGAAIKNLQSAERFLAEQAAKKESTKKAQQIKKAMSMLDRMGLKPEDLGRAKRPQKKASKNPGVKRKVAAKYRITVKGVTTDWSGRGRMPVVFREAIGKNGTIEKHLIK